MLNYLSFVKSEYLILEIRKNFKLQIRNLKQKYQFIDKKILFGILSIWISVFFVLR